MGLLETIRAAVTAPVDDAAQAAEPGAQASTNPTSMEMTMSTQNAAPGAGQNAGVSEADHKAAVVKAEADGRAAGRKEANDRMAAILGADGIKGDGGRMAAGLDLAIQSPDMAAEAVAAFVTANVPASKPSAASGYEQERLASAGLTQPAGDGKPTNDNKSILAAAVARTNKRR